MRILFTGASSFTGFWFVGRLAAAGAEVVAPLRGRPDAYDGVRAERVRWLAQWAEIVPDCPFGGEAFLALVRARGFDALCHHAAEARDYRNADFDVAGALAANTANLRETLGALRERGCKVVVATGSVFEPDEGSGPAPRRAFSPYGLSKGLTWQTLSYWGETLGLGVSKFVIANPFGPFEEPRFVAHAVERWAKAEPLEVRTPRYLRDNIHVDLLSMAYAKFVAEAATGAPARRFGPCGYLETQGAFAERLARELAGRLGLSGEVKLNEQTDFSEPLARVNADMIDPADYGWDEGKAWDALAGYYRQRAVSPAGASLSREVFGAVDEVDRVAVRGWLAARPDAGPRYVRVLADGVERAVLRADLYRADLRDRGLSDGRSGFRFAFPGGLSPYADVAVKLEDRETGHALPGGAVTLKRLVDRAASPFAAVQNFAVVNVGAATYGDDGIELVLDGLSDGAGFAAPRSGHAAVELIDTAPFPHPYFDALGLSAVRMRLLVRPSDRQVPVDIRFDAAEGDELMCANLIPGRLPEGLAGLDEEHRERVSGPGESAGRFAATGLATAFRLDAMAKRHFGAGLASFGRCLDWGAGAGRVAFWLKRVVAPDLALTAVDVDAVNVAFGRAAFPDIEFAETPFLPPLPFPDRAFGSIYGVSVLTHLTEAAQFAWLKELSRVAAPGAPVIVTAHSEFQLFRVAQGRPELLEEAMKRGLSDSLFEENLGPKLAQKSYYRSTFHTRKYILETWSEHFDIVKIYAAGNGAAQDFVVMRAR